MSSPKINVASATSDDYLYAEQRTSCRNFDCMAQPGQRCKTPRGTRRSIPHAVRVRDAIAARRAAGGLTPCTYLYNGRNGGRAGQRCGRPENDHCGGRVKALDAELSEHHDDCRLSLHGKRSMVHHPYHRGVGEVKR